jgi:4-hydroxybenzoate polyprenyltransferase
MINNQPILVVNLDGALLSSGLLFETLLEFLRDNPFRIFILFLWLINGKAKFKHELASATNTDVAVLPYNQRVIELIKEKQIAGYRIILASASSQLLASRVSDYLGFFDDVIASTPDFNLSGLNKSNILIENFGQNNFDYIGNSRDDIPVLAVAKDAYLVNASVYIKRIANSEGNVAGIIDEERSTINDYLKAMRIHHWVKNLLVFVPLLLAHQYSSTLLIANAFQAFFFFGLCASSVYILNDLFDLRADRYHNRKKNRPFASGILSIQNGIIASILLLIMSITLSIWRLPLVFVYCLSFYYLLTLIYSIKLKCYRIIDVVTLSVLHTLRIIAGALALSIDLSFWLLIFSIFIFLSLAMAKRYAELYDLMINNINGKVKGRGYFVSDEKIITTFGVASGYISVVVLALYVNNDDIAQYYSNLEAIWLACPLLFVWISRIWMFAKRGLMNEDPVIFAIRDKFSLCTLALLIVIFWIAI